MHIFVYFKNIICFQFYRDLVSLRTRKVIQEGDFEIKVLSPDNLAILRLVKCNQI